MAAGERHHLGEHSPAVFDPETLHSSDAVTGGPVGKVDSMALLDLVTLPLRVGVAATQVTLALGELVAADGPVRREGGYAARLMAVIGEGGHIERVARTLTDPNGPLTLVNALAAAMSPDRPLGQALSENGAVDRLLAPDGPLHRIIAEEGALDRLLAEGGPLDQLVAPDGPLERLLASGGALDRITQDGGVLDRLLQDQGLLDRLLAEDGTLEKLTADGGTLDQLVALGATLEAIAPKLAELGVVIPELHASVNTLSDAVGPLSELAGRLPRARRRAALEA